MGEHDVELLAYEWECPICSETNRGLAASGTSTTIGQVENALLSHVRNVNDDGHGKGGVYPPDFDPSTALDYAKFSEAGKEEARAVVDRPPVRDGP